MVRYFKYRRILDIFLFGFILALSITIHFQSILLTPTVLILLLFTKPRPKHIGIFLLSMLIPMLPLIYFDVRHYWYNFKSIFIYLAIDQYSIWVPNRWLTYIFSYWPETWGQIIGGNKFLGGGIIILVSILTIVNLKKFRKYRVFYLIAYTFILEIILYRYYRGPRYEYYSYFTYPTVLILSAWAINKILKFQKLVGILILSVVVVSTSVRSISELKETQISLKKINNIKKEIYSAFPSTNFDIFSCPFSGGILSHPLSLVMYTEGRNDENGVGIIVCEKAEGLIWDHLPKEKIPKDANYYSLTTSRVYRSTAEWWKENPPQKDTHFFQFTKRKLNPSCYPRCP